MFLSLALQVQGRLPWVSFFASRNGWKHVDADDYYWLPTDPPYQTKREPALRLEMILRAVHNDSDVIVSGSIMNWGRELEDSFELIAISLPRRIHSCSKAPHPGRTRARFRGFQILTLGVSVRHGTDRRWS